MDTPEATFDLEGLLADIDRHSATHPPISGGVIEIAMLAFIVRELLAIGVETQVQRCRCTVIDQRMTAEDAHYSGNPDATFQSDAYAFSHEGHLLATDGRISRSDMEQRAHTSVLTIHSFADKGEPSFQWVDCTQTVRLLAKPPTASVQAIIVDRINAWKSKFEQDKLLQSTPGANPGSSGMRL